MADRAYNYALALVALLALLLIWGGLAWLDVPPFYRIARMQNPFFFYLGHILIFLAVLLAWFHHIVASRLLWIFKEISRLVSALLMIGVFFAEGIMHALNIPHLEGWWLTIFGGGAFITTISAWLYQWRKKHRQ